MSEQNLKAKTKNGLIWSTLGNVANQGIRFIFGIILARLLSPNDYGIIGILLVFISIVSVFIDCGFSQALISKSDRTQCDFSTEFFFNIGVGIIGYFILFLSAPFISSFYEMPILVDVLRVYGLSIIINSLCVVQSAQFSIKLNFKTPAKLSVGTQTFSGIIGIILAYNGLGVWSLVYQQLVGLTLNAILLWLLAGWRPSNEFSRDSFKYLWNYGSKILGSSLIQQIYDNLYPLIIGKYFSPRSLGLYSRAHGFATLPSTNISGVLVNVTFPVFCKVNDDIARISSIFRQMTKAVAFVVFPLMIGLAALSTPIVKVLLNEQWYECIPLLQLLCFALIWNPLSAIQLNLLKALSKTDIVLKLEIYKRSFGILTIIASIPFGVTGMCVGFIVFYIYSFSLNLFFVCKSLKLNYIKQIIGILPLFVNALFMGVLVYAITYLPVNNIVVCIIGVLSGILYYYVSSRVFFNETLTNSISLLKKS